MAHSRTFRDSIRTRLRSIIIGLTAVPLLATPLVLPPSASATTNNSTQQINSQADAQVGPVELLGAATETVRYWQYPDGRVSTEIWPRPVRVKKSGTWAWIDTTLVKQDGVIKPRVIKGELSLPGDRADTPTTFTPTPGQSIELTWPTPLPAPRLEGNRATYSDAAGRGADLVVTALATGFRYDVVLRDRPSKALESTSRFGARESKYAKPPTEDLEWLTGTTALWLLRPNHFFAEMGASRATARRQGRWIPA